MPRPATALFAMKAEIRASGQRVGQIYLYEQISSLWGTAARFRQELADLGQLDALEIYINSPGGETNEGWAIYNLLKRQTAPITVFIDGVAGSMASIIACLGAEVVMPDNTWFYIHNPFGLVIGESDELRETADRLDRVVTHAIAAYKAKSGLAEEEIQTLMKGDNGNGTWLDAAMAKGKGFCDRVIAAIDEEGPAAHAATLARLQPEALPPALAALAGPPPTQPPNDSPPVLKETPPMDLTTLKAQHPDLLAAAIAESTAAARQEGIAAENARLLALEATALPGYDELLASMKADTAKTAADLALAMAAHQKQQGSAELEALKKNAPHPQPLSTPGTSADGSEIPLIGEAKLKADWQSASAEVKAQYGNDYETYQSYHEGTAAGRFKVLGGK